MMTHNPREAPDGYYAVLKSDIRSTENLCRSCDWRPVCQTKGGRGQPSYKPEERCMSYNRKDGASVVFKLR
jgi:hypothetical protein